MSDETREVRETSTRDGDAQVTKEVVTSSSAPSPMIVLKRIIYFILGVILAFILLRMLFLLLAANRGNVFVDFIYDISGTFVAPFYGIFNYTPVYGSSVFEMSSVVAILVYALVGWGLAKLVTIGSSRREA